MGPNHSCQLEGSIGWAALLVDVLSYRPMTPKQRNEAVVQQVMTLSQLSGSPVTFGPVLFATAAAAVTPRRRLYWGEGRLRAGDGRSV